MAYIEVKNEYKRYQMGETTITANDGISFEVEKGEVAVILGPSGAGKSTVLNILGGMDSCDEGEIIIDGTDIAQFSEKQLTTYRRNDVGFVFQFYNLVPNLTAKENVELASQIVADALDSTTVLQSVGLGERLDNFPAQLSGGEQQMLAMGRALMSRPKLLLLDEPSMGLAPIFIQEIFDIIEDIKAQGTTVLLIEQNANKALSIADRGYVLETGKVVLSGTGEELLASDEVRKAYLGG